jgi:N6-L-threonylcarbamoyladenine synthase
MKILAIETSCDETALSVLEAEGEWDNLQFRTLAHTVASQIALHQPYGGVVPRLAKREHSRNLVPLLIDTLGHAKLSTKAGAQKNLLTIERAAALQEMLNREPELLDHFLRTIPSLPPPPLDAIAVTEGPGLEPALWVGINFAKALGLIWDLPVIGVNHMEGHILSVLATATPGPARGRQAIPGLTFPALALLISGGHTELVLVKDWLAYQILGETRDDAVGEAFDKVARLLDLGYPGGPAIGQLALHGSLRPDYGLPRPMLAAANYDFSFSGLKTAVRYLVEKIKADSPSGHDLTNIHRADIARQFQQAVIDVLVHKTAKALAEYGPRTLIIGGGVVANEELRRQFEELIARHYPQVALRVPEFALATDNATMIGVAGYLRFLAGQAAAPEIAQGTLRLA